MGVIGLNQMSAELIEFLGLVNHGYIDHGQSRSTRNDRKPANELFLELLYIGVHLKVRFKSPKFLFCPNACNQTDFGNH